MLPLKHIHKKKRLATTSKYSVTILDKFMYVVALAGPIMTIPQITDIWVKKQSSVNEITWLSYLFIGLIWLLYGIIHKEKPIIFSNILGIAANALVVVGTMLYRV